MQAIERKFLVTSLPDLSTLKSTSYERWFISLTTTTEIRVQKKGNLYQLQRKATDNLGNLSKQKWILTKQEFTQLKQASIHELPIIRKTYTLSETIQISIYDGFLAGLVRAEIEFKSQEEANRYTPESGMGKEITDEKEGRDRHLVLHY